MIMLFVIGTLVSLVTGEFSKHSSNDLMIIQVYIQKFKSHIYLNNRWFHIRRGQWPLSTLNCLNASLFVNDNKYAFEWK